MASSANVREFASIRPRLRANLRMTFQDFGEERCCLIEDPTTSRFHRVGLPEYRLLRRFDGRTPFSEAFARAAAESGRDALREQEALSVLGWALENHLADLGGDTPPEVLDLQRRQQLGGRLRQVTNLLFIRLPLGSPDAALGRLLPWLGWMCRRPFFFLWLLVMVGAGVQIAGQWDRFLNGAEGVLARDNWLWLGLVWLGLKTWHEFWHGLVCKYYGGHVREAGILLVLFMPMGYVDATSSWGFSSKWLRMRVAAAGIYGELFVAALAALIWSQTEVGLLNTIAFNTMLMASTVTLLFNLNPLMRFDGYYLLSDWLEIPNLGPKGRAMLGRVAARLFLGWKGEVGFHWRSRTDWIVLTYGIAAWFWQIFILATILIAATVLFEGGGLIFAYLALAGMAVSIIGRAIGRVRRLEGGRSFSWFGACFRILFVGVLLTALVMIPIRQPVKAPGLVRFADEVILRADAAGWVEEWLVSDGEEVVSGQPLVRLDNRELETELNRLALRHNRQVIRVRLAQITEEPAVVAAEKATRIAYRDQHAEQQAKNRSLQIDAPVPGTLMAPEQELWLGRYFRTGEEIARLADPDRREVMVPVRQDEADAFREQVGQPVEVRLPDREREMAGTLERMTARAEQALEYPELSSMGGGPLAVKPTGKSEGKEGEPAYEYAQPYLWATVALEGDDLTEIHAGERAIVRFRTEERLRLGEMVLRHYTRLVSWIVERATHPPQT